MHVGRHARTSVSYPDALARATNDCSKGKGRCALALCDCGSLRELYHQGHQSRGVQPYQYPISGYQPYALPWGSLGRTVVLQPTAQELLPHNLQPNLALQSLTGGGYPSFSQTWHCKARLAADWTWFIFIGFGNPHPLPYRWWRYYLMAKLL